MSANPRQRYPFLDILRESEALAKGANLSEKIPHAVFRAIQSLSSSQSARRNALFTLNTPVPDVVNMTRKDLAHVVGRLSTDNVIAQIFRLDYEPGAGGAQLVCCYIAHPADERDTIYHIFSETMLGSTRALGMLLDALPAPSADDFRRDLERDFKSEKSLPAAELSHSIVDPFDAVHASKFDLLPAPELIQRTVEDIRSELVKSGRVADILNYGLMPLRDGEVLMRLETAGDFLMQKIIPKYKGLGALKRQLEEIALEEAAYYMDEFVAQTGDFIVRRAEAVKKTIQSDPQQRGGRFPGQLTIETALAFAPLAGNMYEDRRQKEVDKAIRELREGLTRPSNDWRTRIVFYTEAEKDALNPDVFRELTRDPELIYGTWQRRDGVIHCLVANDSAAFRQLVQGTAEAPAGMEWQALAMKSLLEAHERAFGDLFEDPQFIAAYGRMLRNVYFHYMPWYYRLLLIFNIRLFVDQSFHAAKKNIMEEQGVFGRRNDERLAEYRQKRDLERAEKRRQLASVSRTNRIVEALDRIYMEEGRIALLRPLRDALEEPDDAAFREMLKKEGFQVLPPAGKDAPADEAIVLYPLNHEWRVRAARLRRALDRILQNEASADPAELARARRVLKHISRPEEAANATPSDPEDAYQRFGKELERFEDREKSGAGAP